MTNNQMLLLTKRQRRQQEVVAVKSRVDEFVHVPSHSKKNKKTCHAIILLDHMTHDVMCFHCSFKKIH